MRQNPLKIWFKELFTVLASKFIKFIKNELLCLYCFIRQISTYDKFNFNFLYSAA